MHMDQILEISTLPKWDHLCLHNTSKMIKSSDKQQIDGLKKSPPNYLGMQCVKWFIQLSKSDHTWKKFLNCPWEDIVDIIHDQALRNIEINDPKASKSQAYKGVISYLNRRHNQLPCTHLTTEKRVEIAKNQCHKHDPILIIGDDDCVGIALMKAGFKDVTSVDIDPKVCNILSHQAKQFGLDLKVLIHDISFAPSQKYIRPYRFIFVDPMYSVKGLNLFLKSASQFSNNHIGTKIFLSLHMMSLLRPGIGELPHILKKYSLEVKRVLLGFNSYPIPKSLWYILKVFNLGFMKTTTMASTNYMFKYFHSDAILLEKIKRHIES